jgi:hypothetical protein
MSFRGVVCNGGRGWGRGQALGGAIGVVRGDLWPGRRLLSITPNMVVGALLLVCCAKGLWFSLGVVAPPDPDTVRDLGFIQGFLDGNWFGDPVTSGAWRWYPPLVHGLAAAVVGLLHLPLLVVWLHAGAVLNVLSPLMFAVMNRRLIGAWPAAAATAVFVLFDSVVMAGDAVAGYTPWTLTPALGWPLFFSAVWFVVGRLERLLWRDAVLVGSVLGLVFLAHTVPAVLLSCIVVAVVVVNHGWRWRVAAWVAVVAVVELAWAAPFLLPLAVAYHLHIANLSPGAWVHPALSDPLVLLPNALGVVAAGWLVWRREWLRLPRASMAALGAWIGACVVFLVRHYGCASGAGGACGVFVVSAHHYHVYLQAAWASVLGLALVRVWEMRVWPGLVVLAGVAGLLGFFGKAEDWELLRLGSTRVELVMDREAYGWILAQTRPDDLFVTELPSEGADMGPGAATVIAAGRRLVAGPALHSNPYVVWEPREVRRVGFLRDGADLCPLVREAGAGTAFFLLPEGRGFHGGVLVFRSGFSVIYRVEAGGCAK